MLILKSILIGIGKIIPGISGSVIAMTMGLYEPIINAISNFFKSPKENFLFLFKVFLGIFLAIIFGSKILYYFIENHYTVTLFAIVGFILGGIPELIKKTDYTKKNIIYTIIPFLLVILSDSFFEATPKNSASNFMIIVLGFLEAATTIIPGVSGTALLINIGYYQFNLRMISSFNWNYLIFYLIGVLIGLILLVKIIAYLLRNHQNKFFLIINGLVLASLLSLILKMFENITLTNLALGLIFLVITTLISYLNT
ncbi:MAG: DUF368 domain-containing protein [Bacilli bacterium]|nr:DUF368 domain-containing protein [Bacilli bacterium]